MEKNVYIFTTFREFNEGDVDTRIQLKFLESLENQKNKNFHFFPIIYKLVFKFFDLLYVPTTLYFFFNNSFARKDPSCPKTPVTNAILVILDKLYLLRKKSILLYLVAGDGFEPPTSRL